MALRLKLAGWRTCAVPAAYSEHNRVDYGGIYHHYRGRRFPTLRQKKREVAKGWKQALNRRWGRYSWFRIDKQDRLQIDWRALSDLRPATKARLLQRLRDPFIATLYDGQTIHVPIGKYLTKA